MGCIHQILFWPVLLLKLLSVVEKWSCKKNFLQLVLNVANNFQKFTDKADDVIMSDLHW